MFFIFRWLGIFDFIINSAFCSQIYKTNVSLIYNPECIKFKFYLRFIISTCFDFYISFHIFCFIFTWLWLQKIIIYFVAFFGIYCIMWLYVFCNLLYFHDGGCLQQLIRQKNENNQYYYYYLFIYIYIYPFNSLYFIAAILK